ncbi:hypothetical protein O181_033638 [Austropuccinia psidii MF-1]|uniref:Uncharacterized protein n=1 Tax=Austropuccinia psidii MF-1 TaxID=1389203 RepID=A0A9Q3D1W5_9BASI|nr:hypothetical protein [Austropuccinia psidii MF-1]
MEEDSANFETETIAQTNHLNPINSGLLTLLRGFLDGTHEEKNTNGGIELNGPLLKILSILMDAKESRRKQEFLFKQQEMLISQLQQLTNRLDEMEEKTQQLNKQNISTTPIPKIHPQSSYANKVLKEHITPPTRKDPQLLRLGCTIIHSKPQSQPFNNQQSGLIVQKTNEV